MTQRFLIGLITLSCLAPWGYGQSREEIEKQLVGTWKLVSAMQTLANGTTRPTPNYGPHQAGYMLYTEAGIMCSVNVNPDRAPWKSMASPTPEEIKSALDGLGAYCATYRVIPEEKSVVHHVLFDKLANATGTDRKRYFVMMGNRLVLKIDPKELSGDVVENTVIWERVVK